MTQTRSTLIVSAEGLRPGDVRTTEDGTRMWAAFDTQVLEDSGMVKVWTAVSDQDRGVPDTLLINLDDCLLITRAAA